MTATQPRHLLAELARRWKLWLKRVHLQATLHDADVTCEDIGYAEADGDRQLVADLTQYHRTLLSQVRRLRDEIAALQP